MADEHKFAVGDILMFAFDRPEDSKDLNWNEMMDSLLGQQVKIKSARFFTVPGKGITIPVYQVNLIPVEDKPTWLVKETWLRSTVDPLDPYAYLVVYNKKRDQNLKEFFGIE